MKLEVSCKFDVLIYRRLLWIKVTSGEMTAKFNMCLTWNKKQLCEHDYDNTHNYRNSADQSRTGIC